MDRNRNVIFKFLILLLSCFLPTALFGQSPSSLYSETEFNLELSSSGSFEYSLGLANRSILSTYVNGKKVAGSGQEHLEVNQFTAYKLSQRSVLALGFRYRFKEVFDDEEYDELRILQEFTYSQSSLPFTHRFRFEQRFKNIVTEFRGRYKLGVSQPLSSEFIIDLSTEALYSLANNLKPEAEQRFTLKFSNHSLNNLELNAAFEWQYENYTNSPQNSFFLLTGATLKL